MFMLKQMRLKRILSAFAVRQSGFPSVSMWKLLLKNSNINSKHFVKKKKKHKQETQPINKRLVAQRDINLYLNKKL